MGKLNRLSQLFNLKPPPSPTTSQPSPLSTTPLVKTPQPWEGNLPCVFGPNDGCSLHNRPRAAIFFDPLLFPPSSGKPKPSGNHPPVPGPPPTPPPAIHSHLPQQPHLGCLTPLPRIHKSVPYAPAFYHVALVLDALRAGATPPLGILSCAASTGTNPRLAWSARACIAGLDIGMASSSLLLEYAVTFPLSADLGDWDPTMTHARTYRKEVLIGSGYRDFQLCPHMMLSFRSHWGAGRDGVRTAGVKFVYAVRREGESKGEWTSEGSNEGEEEMEGMCCGKCWTDGYLGFRMVSGGRVVVSVRVYKDLGQGVHPSDVKFVSVATGAEVERREADFGRMRRRFLEMDEEGTKGGEVEGGWI